MTSCFAYVIKILTSGRQKKKCNIEERKRGERVRREKETEEAEQNRGMEMR